MKRLNLVLIASIFAALVFLAPACAMELNHSSDIPMDGSISIDDAIPSDIHIDDGSAVDGLIPSDGNGTNPNPIPSDIPSDGNGTDPNPIPGDNDGANGKVIPIDNIVPDDNGSDANVIPIDNLAPSDDNGSDSNLMPINDLDPSDVHNGPVDEAIIDEVPSSTSIKDNSVLIGDNTDCKNIDSMDSNNHGMNGSIDNNTKVQSNISIKKEFDALDLSYNTLPFENIKNYERTIFDKLGVRSSSIETEDDLFKSFKNGSILDVKKTIDLIDLNSSASAMDIHEDHSLSLDLSTINKHDVLGVNLFDSIFANMSMDDSMDNKTLVKELTPDTCPDLSHFSSDKTFKKCVKTHIFKVRDI